MRDRSIDCVGGAELADARLAEVERRIRELTDIRSALEKARQELVDSALAHDLALLDRLLKHRS